MEEAPAATTFASDTMPNIQYQTLGNIASSSGSLSVWVKTPWAANDSLNHVLLDTDTTAGTLKLLKDSNNNLALTDGTHTASIAASWSSDTWTHIAADWGSSNMHVYVNGTAGTAAGAYSAPTLGANLYLGRDKPMANFWDGNISDFRTYNSVITSSDVTQLYNAGLLTRQETNTTFTVDKFGHQ